MSNSGHLASPKHEIFRVFSLVFGVLILFYVPVILYLVKPFSNFKNFDFLMVFIDFAIILGCVLISISFRNYNCTKRTAIVVLSVLGIFLIPAIFTKISYGWIISLFGLISVFTAFLLYLNKRIGWFITMFLCLTIILFSIFDLFYNYYYTSYNIPTSTYAIKDFMQIIAGVLAFIFVKNAYTKHKYTITF